MELDDNVYISSAGTMHRTRGCSKGGYVMTAREAIGEFDACMSCFTIQQIIDLSEKM